MKISIRAARVNAGLTQKRAAKKLKIGLYTLQKIEYGEKEPTVGLMDRMEKLYSVKREDLIFLS